MRKSIAIAASREDSFHLALDSARNFGALIVDFMYGTPERARMTCWFALALAALGGMMAGDAHSMAVCVN